MVRLLTRFRRDQGGLALTEALLTLPIVLLMTAAFVEFGFVIFQWNQTAKAMQLGARLLAVSEPIHPDFAALGVYPTGFDPGDPVPNDFTARTCGAGAVACLPGPDHMDRLIARMQALNPRIKAENVRVTYARSGLGYVGRPGGPVVSITVESRNLFFNLPLVGALLGWDEGSGIAVPANPVTVTSEDLRSEP